MSDKVRNPYADRVEWLKAMEPQLVADLRLYSTEYGGKAYPAYPGWGCPCVVSREEPRDYDGWPLLDAPMQPGEELKQVGFVFLSADGATAMQAADRFYLREGRVIGEAVIVR